MADTLRITGIEVLGYHGVYPQERQKGQLFIVDIEVELDTHTAAASDALSDTLDYSTLIEKIAQRVAGEPVDLIETLAADLAKIVLTFPQADAVTVTLHKPHAPLSTAVSDVALTIRRTRSDRQ